MESALDCIRYRLNGSPSRSGRSRVAMRRSHSGSESRPVTPRSLTTIGSPSTMWKVTYTFSGSRTTVVSILALGNPLRR
jgi:hypothetical protein